jgi:hypothetical protein
MAINVVGETIVTVFGGNIDDFLAQGAPVFGSIRQLLDEKSGGSCRSSARSRLG